jgi:hypothetical protein
MITSKRRNQFLDRPAAWPTQLDSNICAAKHQNMARIEYYQDVAAPQAQQLLPAAFAIVRNSSGRKHSRPGGMSMPTVGGVGVVM